jgi:membrane-bound metal-dependent hydrolase YbcI (DUF457 family)
MDPVSHAIFGQTLVTAIARHPAATRARSLAAVLGALAPDTDAVLMPFGWDIYLRGHEIGTHSIAGSLVLAGLVALLVTGISRPSRFTDLWWPAWLGCLSHISLDIVSGARIRVAWPLPGGHLSLPLVAMADLWLIAIFTAGAIAMILKRPRRRRVAATVLAIVAVFLGFKSVQMVRSLATLPSATTGAPVLAHVVEARWASLSEWYVFERQPDLLRQWAIRAGAAPRLLLSWPIGAESPAVGASRAVDTVQNFLAVHDLGLAAELRRGDEAVRVLWSDIRYCWGPDSAAAGDPGLEPILTAATADGPVLLA